MKKAVDIVLLPPDKIINLAIGLSRRAYEQGESEVMLNNIDRMPHITLLQGCLSEESQGDVVARMQNLSQTFSPLAVEIIKHGQDGLTIRRTGEIVRLHNSIMDQISAVINEFCDYDSMLESKEHAFDWAKTIEGYYFNTYIAQSSRDNFHPHITTFNSEEENDVDLPITFTADRLALCHMGDHGTCRKILFETKLSAKSS